MTFFHRLFSFLLHLTTWYPENRLLQPAVPISEESPILGRGSSEHLAIRQVTTTRLALKILTGVVLLIESGLHKQTQPSKVQLESEKWGTKRKKEREIWEGKKQERKEKGYCHFPLSVYLPHSLNGRRALGTRYSSRVHHVTFAVLNSPQLGFMSPAGNGLSDSHTPNSSLQGFMPGPSQRLVLILTFIQS